MTAVAVATGSTMQTPSVRFSLSGVTFLIFLASLPFADLVTIPIGSATAYLPDFIFVVVVLIRAAELLVQHRRPLLGRFHLMLGLYVGAVFLAAMTAHPLRSNLVRFAAETYLVLIAVVAFDMIATRDNLRLQCLAWLGGTAAASIATLTAVAFFFAGIHLPGIVGHGSLPEGHFPRAGGFFYTANLFCNYFNVSLMLAFLADEMRWLRPRAAHILITLVAIAASFTLSPGLGGVGLAAGLWLWLRRPQTLLGRAALLAGILVAAGFFFAASVRLFTPIPAGIASPLLQGKIEPSQRLHCWASALHTFTAHPLFGAGPATEVASVDNLLPEGEVEHLTDAHNTWLSIAAHDGVLGLAAFVGLIVYLLRGISLRSPANLPTTALAIAFVTALLFQGWHGSFEHARHLWVVMGWLAAIRHREQSVQVQQTRAQVAQRL